MEKYYDECEKLLQYLGGSENIKAVSHCMTRMRFVLIDDKKADIDKIEELKDVKGTFTQAGQFQVIIGNDVANFYNVFMDVSKLDGVSKDVLKQEAKTKQSRLQRIVGALGEIFAPLIPALICGGLILGFRNCIDSIKLFDDGTKTLVEISQFWAGVDSFLWLIGEAVFHFLPVGIVWSITKKMGTTPILGIVLGITLVSPQLLNAYDVASATKIPAWDFGIFKIDMIGYQAQVIPAMLAGFALVYLERFFKKIIPNCVSMIFVPFLSLLIAVILAQTIIGPVGWMIGNGISDVVYAGLTSKFNFIFAGIFGLLYAPLVITGLHHMTNAIDTQLVATFKGTILWPMIALSNIAQGSAVLAMAILQRKDEKAQQINIPATISCYLGVTEPALFGVNLKYMFPFIAGMIGSSFAAMISVSMGVKAISIGVGGIPGFLSIFFKYWPAFFLAMAVAIVVPFVITYVIGKKKLNINNDKAKEKTNNKKKTLLSPVSGEVVDLSDVDDQVFSEKMMGDGFACYLNEGKIIAPFDGEVVGLFPTKHAYGLKSENGLEILIHVGMDTVELNGNGFDCKVSLNQKIKKGDLLCEVDLNYLKEQGKSIITPVVLPNNEKVKVINEGKINYLDPILEVEEND